MVNQNDINNPGAVVILGEVAINGSSANQWGETLPQGNVPSIGACYVTNTIPGSPFPCDNHFVVANEYLYAQITPGKSCNAMIALWHGERHECSHDRRPYSAGSPRPQ